jgi:hypothetical protein
MKTFRNWTRQELADEFDLKKKRECQILNDWLSFEVEVSDFDKQFLEKLRLNLEDAVDIWNEQELIIKFIAPLITSINYDTNLFKSFANRPLKGFIKDTETNGEVDFMIASGDFEPKSPYFCLQEYKKEKNIDNDPLGQLLVAMMTAQSINKNEFPIYGAYVTGRNWFFLTLTGTDYCISNEYVATRNDINDIYRIMKAMKVIIEKMIKNRI